MGQAESTEEAAPGADVVADTPSTAAAEETAAADVTVKGASASSAGSGSTGDGGGEEPPPDVAVLTEPAESATFAADEPSETETPAPAVSVSRPPPAQKAGGTERKEMGTIQAAAADVAAAAAAAAEAIRAESADAVSAAATAGHNISSYLSTHVTDLFESKKDQQQGDKQEHLKDEQEVEAAAEGSSEEGSEEEEAPSTLETYVTLGYTGIKRLLSGNIFSEDTPEDTSEGSAPAKPEISEAEAASKEVEKQEGKDAHFKRGELPAGAPELLEQMEKGDAETVQEAAADLTTKKAVEETQKADEEKQLQERGPSKEAPETPKEGPKKEEVAEKIVFEREATEDAHTPKAAAEEEEEQPPQEEPVKAEVPKDEVGLKEAATEKEAAEEKAVEKAPEEEASEEALGKEQASEEAAKEEAPKMEAVDESFKEAVEEPPKDTLMEARDAEPTSEEQEAPEESPKAAGEAPAEETTKEESYEEAEAEAPKEAAPTSQKPAPAPVQSKGSMDKSLHKKPSHGTAAKAGSTVGKAAPSNPRSSLLKGTHATSAAKPMAKKPADPQQRSNTMRTRPVAGEKSTPAYEMQHSMPHGVAHAARGPKLNPPAKHATKK